MQANRLPFDLRREFVTGNIVVFVGAGLVRNYVPSMPLWEDLLKGVFATLSGNELEIFNYCSLAFDERGRKIVPVGEYLRLAEKFEFAREKLNRERRACGQEEIGGIHDFVVDRLLSSSDSAQFQNAVRGKNIEQARDLPLPVWITTNFDLFLEHCVLDLASTSVLSRPVRNEAFRTVRQRQLFKIHGSIDSEVNPSKSIVITESDYHRFLRSDRYLTNKLYTMFCERTVVFLGYSLSDPNIQYIYNEVLYDQKGFGDGRTEQSSFSQLRPAFFISRDSIREEEKSYFLHKRIIYISNHEIEDFFGDLISAWEEFQFRKKSIIDRVRAEASGYLDLYKKLEDYAGPTVTIADDLKQEYLEKLFDIIELHEVLPGSADPVIDGVALNRLAVAVVNAIKLIEDWCDSTLRSNRPDLMESLFDFFEQKLGGQCSFAYTMLLERIERLLLRFRSSESLLTQFVKRYGIMLLKVR